MKTKVGKLNILLVAIMLLLIFVGVLNFFGKTNSWLIANDTINISVAVSEIDIEVKQGDRVINNEGFMYLGSKYIESDTTYDFEDISLHNNEVTKGYYIRCQVFAKIGDKLYNINNCVSNELYKATDGWMYYTGNSQIKVAKQLEAKDEQDPTKGVVPIIKTLTIPNLLEDNIDDTKDVYFSDCQGKVFTLHLFIEGSVVQYNIP